MYLARDRELLGLLTTKYEQYLVHKIEKTRRQLAFEGSFIIYLSHLNLAIDGTEVGIATQRTCARHVGFMLYQFD